MKFLVLTNLTLCLFHFFFFSKEKVYERVVPSPVVSYLNFLFYYRFIQCLFEWLDPDATLFKCFFLKIYLPQRSCGKVMSGRHPPSPRAETHPTLADIPLGRHPQDRHTPLGRHNPFRQTPLPSRRLLQRTVRILLECILVFTHI